MCVSFLNFVWKNRVPAGTLLWEKSFEFRLQFGSGERGQEVGTEAEQGDDAQQKLHIVEGDNAEIELEIEDYIDGKISETLGEYYDYAKFIQGLKNADRIQARMPFELRIR